MALVFAILCGLEASLRALVLLWVPGQRSAGPKSWTLHGLAGVYSRLLPTPHLQVCEV